MRRFLSAAALLLSIAAVARAEDAAAPATDPVADGVARFLGASEAAAREKAAADLVAAKADPARVATLLAAGRPHGKDAKTGWQERMHRGADGVERAWLLYVPGDYDPAKPRPFWIDMHGGVSMPNALTHEELQQMSFFWGKEAATRGFLLALPAGQAGAEWWTENGAGNVLGILATVKREYAVDPDRVVATGFSDGGSGAYYLALTHPDPFAAIVPLNGHVGVAGVKGLQVHLRNLVNMPVYAVNTDQDSLYPSEAIRPLAEALKALSATFTWREIKGFAHDPSYLPGERGAIGTWVDAHPRVPHPERAVWEGTADAPTHGALWLDAVKVADRGEAATFPDVNPVLPTPVRLGINIDTAFEGPGVKVSGVAEGSPAAAAGVAVGDVITGLDAVDIAGVRDLRRALAAKAHGQDFRVRLKRGEEKIEKEGRLAEAGPQPALDRTRPFGTVDARRKGNGFDVTCANVESFDLLLGAGAVDPSKPVVVRVNGKEVSNATVAPDLAFLLARAAKDDDPRRIYFARVTVRSPAPSKEAPNK